MCLLAGRPDMRDSFYSFMTLYEPLDFLEYIFPQRQACAFTQGGCEDCGNNLSGHSLIRQLVTVIQELVSYTQVIHLLIVFIKCFVTLLYKLCMSDSSLLVIQYIVGEIIGTLLLLEEQHSEKGIVGPWKLFFTVMSYLQEKEGKNAKYFYVLMPHFVFRYK